MSLRGLGYHQSLPARSLLIKIHRITQRTRGQQYAVSQDGTGTKGMAIKVLLLFAVFSPLLLVFSFSFLFPLPFFEAVRHRHNIFAFINLADNFFF